MFRLADFAAFLDAENNPSGRADESLLNFAHVKNEYPRRVFISGAEVHDGSSRNSSNHKRAEMVLKGNGTCRKTKKRCCPYVEWTQFLMDLGLTSPQH